MSWGQRPTRRIKGDRFKSVAEFSEWIADGGWVWWRHKAYSPKVIENLQFRIIAHSIARADYASLHKAIRNRAFVGRTQEQIHADAAFNARCFFREQTKALRNFHIANGARTDP